MKKDMSGTADSKNIAVILVPHAGGDRLSYAPLIKGLSDGGDVFFYEPAGHGKRAGEAAPDGYEAVLEELVGFIKDIASDHEKYILCGDSMGAYLCDNAYGRLAQDNERLPVHVVYAAVDPSGDLKRHSIDEIIKKSSDPAFIYADNPYSRYLRGILEKDIELLMQADAVFGARLQCPMSFFAGKDDRLLGKITCDWSGLAPCGYREYLFEGGHLFMTANKNVITTLMTIRDRTQE